MSAPGFVGEPPIKSAESIESPSSAQCIKDDELSAATRKLRMLRTLVCGMRYEKAARALGATRIAGVDEVGRGALFGPVVAAAVVLPEGCRIRGLRDSKQLTPEDRERLSGLVQRRALSIAIHEIDAATIDRVNIYQATRLAMKAAVEALSPTPDHLLVDALRIDLPCKQTSIIYGDSLSISIAAASVVAKVYRDRRMCEYHEQYPQYGLHAHKGYSTPEHLSALRRHGPSPLHRRSFRPVALSSLPWDLWPDADASFVAPTATLEAPLDVEDAVSVPDEFFIVDVDNPDGNLDVSATPSLDAIEFNVDANLDVDAGIDTCPSPDFA